MPSKSSYILANREQFEAHPATFEILDALRAPSCGYKIAKEASQINGMWFRSEVVNVADMATAAGFFNPRDKNFTDSNAMLRAGLNPHVSIEDTSVYLASINKRVIFFLEMYGTTNLLPFHQSQRLFFRVNPCGTYSNQSTAVYYQSLRCGFIERFTSYNIHKHNTIPQIEAAYGIIEGVSGHHAIVRMFIPKVEIVEAARSIIPTTIEWEREGAKGKHLPLPAHMAPYIVGA